MPISLTPEIERKPLLSLDPAEAPHTEEFQGAQAAKLHVTLGANSPGEDQIATMMSTGNADVYRGMLADQDRISQIQTQNDLLDSVLQSDPSVLTPEVVQVVHSLSNLEMASPDLSDIIEKKYAQKFVTTAAAALGNDVLDDAMTEDPQKTQDIIDRSEGLAYKQNYVNSILDEADADIQNQSWLGTAWNIGENMFAGRYQTYDQVQAAVPEDLDLPALPGMNRLEGYAFLWSLPPAEFKTTVDAIKEDLKSRNPYAFKEWFSGMVSFGYSDATLNTIDAAVDVASLIPVGKLAKVATFGKAMKDTLRASTLSPKALPEITGAMGKNLDSGLGAVAKDLQEGTLLGGIRKAKELEKTVPNALAPDALMNGGTMLAKASYLRIKDAILENTDLIRRILDTNKIDTLTPEELLYLRDDLSAQYMRDHPQISKNVIGVDILDPDVANVYQARVLIGQRNGELFESKAQAQNYFNRFFKKMTDDYQIVQKGEGWQIQINKTLDESRVSNFELGPTQITPASKSDWSSIASALRTPVELLSDQQNKARAVLTSTKEKVDTLFGELSAPIGDLSKRELREIDDLLFVNQKQKNFYDDLGELEQAFYDRHKKPPTEKQIKAYFAYTNISDLDLIIRDLNWYKQKAALGVEEVTVSFVADVAKDQTQYWKQTFEARVLDRLPYESTTPFKVGIVQDGKIISAKTSVLIGQKEREKIQKLLDQGYKVINPISPDFKVTSRKDSKYFDYLIVKKLERNRVGVKNVDRVPGGHKIVKYPYYMKQGKVADEIYRGDQTFFNFRTEQEAIAATKPLEEARLKMLRGDKDALTYVRDHLPISTREWIAAINDGKISLTEPFVVTRSGSRTIDTAPYKAMNLKDMTKSEHKPAIQLTGRFGGERGEDVSTMTSEDNILWKIEPAEYLAPLEAMKTASSDMISTHLFDDYRNMTLKNFIREFSDILDGTPNEIRAQGLAAIQNPTFKIGAEQTPSTAARVQRAKNVSRAFNNLMDNSDAFSRKVELYKEKLIAPILPKRGERGEQWLSERMLSKTKNPGVFLKSMAFHMKMGFFNIKQLFTQAQTTTQIVAIAGANGLKGTFLYPFTRAMVMTNSPEVLRGVAQKVQALGLMSSDDFVEAMGMFKKSGFNEIGGDLAYIDDLASPELIRSKTRRGVSTALRVGTTPFYEGERMTRMSGFMAAYLEKKALAKGRKLTRRDEADILYRAKTLVGNMTREANTSWQKGYASVLTQFFGFQARIMEQLLGKQLTSSEKARLFIGYSMMYGLPVAGGAVAGVFPVRDFVIDQMLESGMNPEDPLAKPFIDGFANTMINYMFDKDLNIATTYGPGGLPTLYDLIRGDKEIADLLLGASGGIALQTAMDAWPLRKVFLSETENLSDGFYNVTVDDMVKPLRNITTVNSLFQMYKVYNTGIWASKNGFDLAKMNLPDAVLAALTGLRDSHIDLDFSKLRASKELKADREAAFKDLTNRLRLARKVESSKTREMLIRGIKAELNQLNPTLYERERISRYAHDSDTLSDIALEQYEKEMKRMDRSGD